MFQFHWSRAMIKPVLALCAEQVITDRETNAMSIINVFQNIPCVRFPAAIQKFHCLFIFSREQFDPLKLDAIFVLKVNNQEKVRQPVEFNWGGGDTFHNLILGMSGLLIQEPSKVDAEI